MSDDDERNADKAGEALREIDTQDPVFRRAASIGAAVGQQAEKMRKRLKLSRSEFCAYLGNVIMTQLMVDQHERGEDV